MSDTPRTILFVNHVGVTSGAEESMLALIAALDRRRFRPIAACPNGLLKRRLEQLDVPVFKVALPRVKRTLDPVRLIKWGLRWRKGMKRLRRVLIEEKVDLVHANSTEAHVHVGPAARRFGIPVIWHARDLISLSRTGGYLARRAACVVAISDAVVENLAGQGVSREKIVRIYNGLDIDAFRKASEADTTAPWQDHERPVLMVAQLVPWKRHEDFIRAMAVVIRGCANARGVLVGPDLFGDHPGYFNGLKSVARRLGIAGRVTFAGQRADVPSLMRRCEVLCVPSDGEPFGRVAMEAMALGRPVVGTKAGGLPEVMGSDDTVPLVPVGDHHALATEILGLLNDPARARVLGERGRERAERLFRIQDVARRVEALYTDVLTDTAQ